MIQNQFFFQDNVIQELKTQSIFNPLTFWDKINTLFSESYRILRPNAKMILVIGDMFHMKENLCRIAIQNEFSINRIMKRRVVNWKNKNHHEEYVLIFKKEAYESIDCWSIRNPWYPGTARRAERGGNSRVILEITQF